MESKNKFLSSCKMHCMFAIPMLLFTSCSNLFQGRVGADITNLSAATLGGLLVDKEVITVLDPPEQIFVSENEYNNRIVINWTAVSGAAYYVLERAVVKEKQSDGTFAVPEESEFEEIRRVYDSVEFSDVIISEPKFSSEEYKYGYFYRVSAENPAAKLEASEYLVSSTAGTLFAPAYNVRASLGESESSIKVEWDPVPGAARYEVYRTPNADGSGESRIASVSSNQNWYTNAIGKAQQGVEYYYSIVVKNTFGVESVSSSLALGYSLVAGAPAQVKNVTVTNGRGNSTDEITIGWDGGSDDKINYSVYRTSSSDSSYTLLTSNASGASYTDKKSLKTNEYYYYQVQAWKWENAEEAQDPANPKKLKGPFSASSLKDTNPAEGFILGAPKTISVKKDKDSGMCKIEFTSALGSSSCPDDSKLSANYNSYSYKIYSSDTENGAFSEGPTIQDSNSADGKNVCTVASANFYKVSTLNGSTESEQSEVVAPAPDSVKNVYASKAGYIPSITNDDANANSSGVHAVEITWQEPEGGASGGYNIYRSVKKDSGFRKINNDAIQSNSYYDYYELAKAGVPYYYRVLSLNSLKQGANYSETVTGYGALTAEQYMREYNKTVKMSQKKLTLMHKSSDTDKLGSETISGDISGTLSYNAAIAGLGAEISMHYSNYAEVYINKDSTLGVYFLLNGNTDTTSNMSGNGHMHESVTCSGMYPGAVRYNSLQIKGGAAGGGTYGITRSGFPTVVEVSWLIGEE